MSKKVLPGEVTPEVIAKWKEEFEAVFCYKTADGKVAYFRSPERKEIEAANSVGSSKPIESNAILAKAVFLGGDEEILTVNKYFFGFSEHLKTVIKKVEGELTEL